MRFRIFIALLVALLLAYVVFWFVLADQAEKKVVAAIDAQRRAGAAIAYDALDVRGFPYRLEFAAINLDMAREEPNGVSWRVVSPELVVVLQPWRLTHAILFAEDLTATLSEASDSTTLVTRNMRASVVTDEARVPLRIAMETEHLTASGSETGNQVFSAENVDFHWRRPTGNTMAALAGTPAEGDAVLEPLSSQWAIRGERLHHPAFGKSPYGETIQRFMATLSVRGEPGDRFDRQALAVWRDQGGTLELTQLSMAWGALDLIVEGSVSLDDRFRPLGAFTAQVKGYEAVIDHLQQAGEIDATEAETVKQTLRNITSDDEEGRLTIPIAMQSGRLFIGPLPVANLPPVIEE
ncbi:MAG: DUF2125 domain-containing protein [Alphaproteobacteria bacterium]|nr:MAG: DUF2125 domain-containing protein [Alphaproteobacteria bacterium]